MYLMTIKVYLPYIQKEKVYMYIYIFPSGYIFLSGALSDSFSGTVPYIYKPLYFMIKRK